MVSRDVDLIIRARDQARNTLNGITQAIDQFSVSQERAQAQSGETDSALERLGGALAQLRAQLSGQNVGAQISGEVGRAQAAFERLEASTREAAGEAIGYAGDAARAARATRDLSREQSRLAGTLEREEQALRDVGLSQRQARSVLSDLRTRYRELEQAVRTAARSQSRLEGSARTSAAALRQQDASLERAEQAYRGIQQEARETAAALGRLERVARGPLLQAFGEQVRRTRDLNQAFQRSSAQAQRFAREMRSVSQPSRELAEAFERSRAAAARARQEFRAQQAVLAQIRGVLRESGGDLQQFASRQQRVAAALERGRAGFRGFAQAQERATAATQRYAQQSERAAAATTRLATAQARGTRATRGFAGAIRNFYGNTRTALSFTQRLRSEVLSLVAAYGGLFAAIRGVTGVVDAFRTIETAQNRLNVVFSQDQSQVADTLDFIRRTARRLGIQFGVLAQEFTKFAVATQGTNLAGQRTRDIFTAVAEAGRVQNLSLDQIEGTFLALTQIVSKGVVTMEELRRQLGDRLPGAIQIMAAALNLSVAELIELVETGDLSADVLGDFADELNRRFGAQLPTALNSLNAAIGRFQNATFEAFRRIGDAGAIEGFRELFVSLTETFESAQFLTFLDNLGVVLAGLAQALALLVSNFDLLIVAMTTFIALKLAPFVVAIATAFGRWQAVVRLTRIRMNALRRTLVGTTAATGTLAGAVRGLRAAFIGLLSSTGIGLLVTLIGAGIGLWVTRTDETVEAATRLERVLDRIKNAVDAAADAFDFREQLDTITQTEVEAELQRIDEAFQQLIEDIEEFREQGDPLRQQFPFLANLFDGIAGLLIQLEQGEITLQQFRRGLDELDDDGFEKITESALSFGDRISELTERQNTFQAVLLAQTGSLGDLELAYAALSGEVDEAGEAIGEFQARSVQSTFREAEVAARLAELTRQRIAGLIVEANQRDLIRAGLEDQVEIENAVNEARRENVNLSAEDEQVIRRLTQERLDALRQERAEQEALRVARREAEDQAGAVRATRERIAALIVEGNERELIRAGLEDQVLVEQAITEARRENAELSRQDEANIRRLTQERLDALRRERAEEEALQNARARAEDRAGAVRATRERIASLIVEVNQRTLILSGLEDQVEIERAIAEARRENVNLTIEDEESIRRLTQDRLDLLRQERAEQDALRAARREAEDRATAQRATRQTIAALVVEANERALIRAGLEDQAIVERAIVEARRENVDLTIEEDRLIRRLTQERLDALRAEREEQEALQRSHRAAEQRFQGQQATDARIANLTVQISQQTLIEEGLQRQVAIENALIAARRENVNLTAEQAALIAQLAGEYFDVVEQARALQEQERAVNEIVSLRSALQQEIAAIQQTGIGTDRLPEVEQQLDAANAQLREAANNFLQVLSAADQSDPAIRALISRMRALGRSTQDTANRIVISFAQISMQIASGATNALDNFFQALSQGENAIQSLANAFRQFAADFLRQIARMILQQIIFNSLRSAFGGSFLSFHEGGLVGQGGRLFQGSGLRRDEIPAILQTGEEVLERDDPRNVRNLGQGGGDGDGAGTTIINAVDGQSFLEEALSQREGHEVILNVISANRSAVRSVLGIT